MVESYWKRRWQNTRRNTWPGFTPQVMAVNVIGLLIGIASCYWFGGAEFAKDELKGYFLFTFASVLAANSILMVWNWIMSAARIADEDSKMVQSLERRLEEVESSSKRLVDAKVAALKLKTASLLSDHVERTLTVTTTTRWTDEELKEFNDRKTSLKSHALQLEHCDGQLSGDIRDAVHLADCVTFDVQSHLINYEDRHALSALTRSIVRRLHGASAT